MDLNFRLPKFLQRGARHIPVVGDIINALGEYSNNIKTGMPPQEAARRAGAVGAAGAVASMLPPADVPTYAPSILRYGAEQQRTTPTGRTYESLRSLGVAAPPNPQVLEKTAEMLDYVNPEGWARAIVDKLDPALRGETFSMDPEERLKQIRSFLSK